jgi:hypothetical protein
VTSEFPNGCTVNASPYVTSAGAVAPALRSARIPPGFMNAATAPAPVVEASAGPRKRQQRRREAESDTQGSLHSRRPSSPAASGVTDL